MPLEPLFFGSLVFIPLGAVVVGVLQPWVRDVYGAALVGWLVTLPIVATFVLATAWPPQWNPRAIFFVLALSFALGSLFGAAAWVGRARRLTKR